MPLELAGVRSGYGEAVVVRDVELDIRPGEIFALLGKNGMGKSTLLKTVMGFLAMVAGKIKCFGEDLTAHSRVAYSHASLCLSGQASPRANRDADLGTAVNSFLCKSAPTLPSASSGARNDNRKNYRTTCVPSSTTRLGGSLK